jgi:hypothetical protein
LIGLLESNRCGLHVQLQQTAFSKYEMALDVCLFVSSSEVALLYLLHALWQPGALSVSLHIVLARLIGLMESNRCGLHVQLQQSKYEMALDVCSFVSSSEVALLYLLHALWQPGALSVSFHIVLARFIGLMESNRCGLHVQLQQPKYERDTPS